MKTKQSEKKIHASAERLALNYQSYEAEMYGKARRIPNRDAVIEIIADFQKLFFPIYYGERELLRLPPEEYAALLMDRISDRLQKQIALTMEETPENALRAAEICDCLIEKIPQIHQTLLKDLSANFAGDPAAHNIEDIIFSYPGFYAICVYRVAHELYVQGVPMIPRIMTEYAHAKTGVDINPGATIGENFFIDHGTGIVVGETSVIGNNVNLYQGVTLGALSPIGMESAPGERRHPKVGNHVTIYANSTLLGGETEIGDDVVIGSNVFLTESVRGGTKVSIKKPEVRLREKK